MDPMPMYVSIIKDGGLPIVLFIIWYLSFKQQIRRDKEIMQREKEMMQQYLKQIDEDIKYKEILIGILSKVEVKLDSHIKDK